ncbi:hypothetical protein C0993_006154, partial [Termitomyces sp. T159_Od127]
MTNLLSPFTRAIAVVVVIAGPMSKFHPFSMAPPPQLRKTPDSIPSATKLELCTTTLKRSKKACDDGCAIEEFMRHMKEKEKGKARAEHE